MRDPRVGLCTGCKAIIQPGPYFMRRIFRHLRLWWHNHDGVEYMPMSLAMADQRKWGAKP